MHVLLSREVHVFGFCCQGVYQCLNGSQKDNVEKKMSNESILLKVM